MKKVLFILAAIWLAVLLRLTVFRDDCFSNGLFSGRIEWDAFAYYAKLVRVGYWRYFTYLFVGNLVWFMPVGALIRIREAQRANGWQIAGAAGAGDADGRVPSLRHRSPRIQGGCLWKAALWGFLLSLFVETGQFVLGSGISELDDLILNTVGAVLGYAAACLWYKITKNTKSPIDKKPQDIDNRR